MAIRHIILGMAFIVPIWTGPSAAVTLANDAPKTQRIVEPIPTPKLDNLYRVSANKTPSGFAVPRFVSLKFSKINARTGPSGDHPIAYQYRQRGLPLVVVAETQMWRKVRDVTGDEAWVRKSALSGRSFALALRVTSLRSKPRANGHERARIEPHALLKLETCNKNGWCEVKSASGRKGWVRQDDLWGAKL